jgi:hypothetical protein
VWGEELDDGSGRWTLSSEKIGLAAWMTSTWLRPRLARVRMIDVEGQFTVFEDSDDELQQINRMRGEC